MSRSITALANRELLVWARKSAGLNIATAAKRIGQSEERLESWEREGGSSPTIAQLRKAAEVYRRPLAVFYLPQVPRDFAPLRDFRQLVEGASRELSTKLRFLVRHAQERQQWAVETRKKNEVAPLGFVGCASTRDDLASLARGLRGLLGVTLEDQGSWGTPEDALREWIGAYEEVGIFVFQSHDVPLADMRGLALTDPLAPVILLNAKDARSARVFTLFHELAHIAIGEAGISDLYLPERPATAEESIEVFCNAVAAETLVPAASLTQTVVRRDLLLDLDAAIGSLSVHYKVSREVIARRLSNTGFISRETYQEKRVQYQREFEVYQRELEEQRRLRKIEYRLRHARLVARDNGPAFSRLVLSAYGEGAITGRDVSNLLGVKLRHLAGIQAEVFR